MYYEHNNMNGTHTDVRVVLRRLKSDLQDINNEQIVFIKIVSNTASASQ